MYAIVWVGNRTYYICDTEEEVQARLALWVNEHGNFTTEVVVLKPETTYLLGEPFKKAVPQPTRRRKVDVSDLKCTQCLEHRPGVRSVYYGLGLWLPVCLECEPKERKKSADEKPV